MNEPSPLPLLRASRVQGVGLGLAAAGLAATALARGAGPSVPLGVWILLGGLVGVVALRGLAGAFVGLVATGLVAQRVVLSGQLADLGGQDLVVALARGVECAGLLVAGAAAAWRLAGAVRGTSAGAIGGLVVLCAVGAELLAAYDDSTGQVGPVLFAIGFFAALYGAPALLAREWARRLGWGWPSKLLLCGALGLLQAGVIDQALFSEDYREIEGWEASRAQTFVPWLGVSAHMALNFVIGHVIYSFAAPIAVAEAWRPSHAEAPWLRAGGLVVALVAYGGSAALIASDPESHSASVVQLGGTLSAVALCVAGAAWIARWRRRGRAGRAPSPALVLLAALGVALISSLGDEDWVGVALGVGGLGIATVGIGHLSRAADWTVHHTAAVALGFLLSRGLLAFTYSPLVGEVSAPEKYAHNVVMLGIVLMAGWRALGPRRGGDGR